MPTNQQSLSFEMILFEISDDPYQTDLLELLKFSHYNNWHVYLLFQVVLLVANLFENNSIRPQTK